MKNLAKLLIIASGVFTAVTSCTDVETDTKSSQGFINCYAVVTDTQTGNVSVSQPVTVGLALNWTQTTAEASFSGLIIDGSTYPQMVMSGLKWTSNNLWGYMTNNPEALLATGQQVTINNFNFEWSDRMDLPDLPENTYDPAFVYSFVIDNRYNIEGSRTPFNFWGTTTASSTGVEPFTSGVNNIVAAPDFKKMTMTVLVNGAQFAEKMPALNIQLDNIPMELVDNGKTFKFQADSIIPTIGGTPYDNYPCSNISGTLDPKTEMTFTFDCNVLGRVIYTVTTSPTVFGYRQ